MKSFRFLMTTLLGFAIVWISGFAAFSVDALKLSPKLPLQGTADGIVVLTGGAQRVSTGLDLLTQGRGKRLLISGVHKDVKPHELLPEPSRPIDLGYDAQNTIQNAQETRGWVISHGYQSIILVTSRYHMRRALLEFAQRLPNVKLFAYPVSSLTYAHQEELLLRILWREYNKYILALVRAVVRYGALQIRLT